MVLGKATTLGYPFPAENIGGLYKYPGKYMYQEALNSNPAWFSSDGKYHSPLENAFGRVPRRKRSPPRRRGPKKRRTKSTMPAKMTESRCRMFLDTGQQWNPLTGRSIKRGGPTHSKILGLCLHYGLISSRSAQSSLGPRAPKINGSNGKRKVVDDYKKWYAQRKGASATKAIPEIKEVREVKDTTKVILNPLVAGRGPTGAGGFASPSAPKGGPPLPGTGLSIRRPSAEARFQDFRRTIFNETPVPLAGKKWKIGEKARAFPVTHPAVDLATYKITAIGPKRINLNPVGGRIPPLIVEKRLTWEQFSDYNK